MTVTASDITHHEQLQRDSLFRLSGITPVLSSIVLKEINAETRLPLPEAASGAGAAAVGRKER